MQDLEAGRSVAFGFIGSADVSGTNVAPPENYLVNGEPIDDVGGTPSPVPVEPSPTDPVAADPVAADPGPTATRSSGITR